MLLVSVIIPVYNAEKYIKECLNSVLTQTLKNLEVICIDDGSTDNSLQTLQEYQQNDSRVRVLIQENKGSGPARNRGMKEACGKYIAFLDADDFWYDKFVLEKIVCASDENLSSVTGAFWGYYKNNIYERAKLHQKYFDGRTVGKWIDFREEQNCYNYGSYLYQREFLMNNNIFFPSYYRFQDPPFLSKALITACSYFVIPVDWYCYRTIYKKTLSSIEKTVGFVKGITDVLEIAEKHQLQKLFGEMFIQVDAVTPYIISGIMSGNTELFELLHQLNEYAVDKDVKLKTITVIEKLIYNQCQMLANAFWKKIKNTDQIIIYGAGYYGNLLLQQLEKYSPDLEIVFAETGYPKETKICGRECMRIDELTENRENALVIIAVLKQTQPAMVSNIKRLGFENYMCLDMELMTALECMG